MQDAFRKQTRNYGSFYASGVANDIKLVAYVLIGCECNEDSSIIIKIRLLLNAHCKITDD
jgi:hypothetical protein